MSIQLTGGGGKIIQIIKNSTNISVVKKIKVDLEEILNLPILFTYILFNIFYHKIRGYHTQTFGVFNFPVYLI